MFTKSPPDTPCLHLLNLATSSQSQARQTCPKAAKEIPTSAKEDSTSEWETVKLTRLSSSQSSHRRVFFMLDSKASSSKSGEDLTQVSSGDRGCR